MKVVRWGDSLAVRLDQKLIEALSLKEGDDIEFDAAVRSRASVVGCNDREQLLARLRAFRGRWPAGAVFDRDEANAR